MAVDFVPDGNTVYQTLFLIGKGSTLTGQFTVTKDGVSYLGPRDVKMEFVDESGEPEGPDVTEVSSSEATQDAWYTLRLNPYKRIIHSNVNPSGWLNGYYVVLPDIHPVLGFYEGDGWYIAIDRLDTPYTLAFNVGSLSTGQGDMIVTKDGAAYYGPLDIWLTSASSGVEPGEGESLLMP